MSQCTRITVSENLSDACRIEEAGARLLFLPPYSPDFNPIEMAFSKLKALLRKAAVRTIDELWTAIAENLDAFTPQECQNYFAAAGYVIWINLKPLLIFLPLSVRWNRPICSRSTYSFLGKIMRHKKMLSLTHILGSFMRIFCSFFILLGGIAQFALSPALGQSATPDEIACKSNENSAKACFVAAIQYATGQGVAKDYARAAELFVKACDRDEAQGCYNAGFLYYTGQGVAKDHTRATQLFVKACDGDEAQGCYNAGIRYATGQGVAKDHTRATQLFVKACDGDKAQGCYNAGIGYATGQGVAKDQTRAAQLYVKACDGDDAKGCYNAGIRYDRGRGVAKDQTRAIQLYVKACDGDEAQGCYNAGFLYAKGQGVAKDQTRATQLYVKACDGDEALGCFHAGVQYAAGQGVAKDQTRAAQLHVKACELGYRKAC